VLVELRVRNLGVVEDATLVLDEGMTALTGETGAGKTMVVEAIRLLTGGRAEQHVVRVGASEAIVEGRFYDGTDEMILQRVVRKDGRSRCSINGEMVTATALSERGGSLVDLHGQHAHQTLLNPSAQRDALDAFGGIDTTALHEAQRRLREIDDQLRGFGGDAHARFREIDLLKFQLEELSKADIEDANEDDRLREESENLADAHERREAVARVGNLLSDETGMRGQLTEAMRITGNQPALAPVAIKLDGVAAQLDDAIAEAGNLSAEFEDNPDRLDWIQERRAMLKQLQRKYGATLEEVIAYREDSRKRLDELVRHDDVIAELEAEHGRVLKEIEKQSVIVRKARQLAAPKLAAGVEARLRDLALPNARFVVEVPESGAGDAVSFQLGPNPGMPVLPVAKAASGGELARTMLALRLSLLESSEKFKQHPPTLVFDEVDAGIGGEAALLVGRALAELSHGTNNQVFVVTHLAQVAAFADHQVNVRKDQDDGHTASEVVDLTKKEREIELARMLSGKPDSKSGRAHARELLAQAART
jgi:DNA repair protein RecN (Recombination protein N)